MRDNMIIVISIHTLILPPIYTYISIVSLNVTRFFCLIIMPNDEDSIVMIYPRAVAEALLCGTEK